MDQAVQRYQKFVENEPFLQVGETMLAPRALARKGRHSRQWNTPWVAGYSIYREHFYQNHCTKQREESPRKIVENKKHKMQNGKREARSLSAKPDI